MDSSTDWIEIDLDAPVWERFTLVAPLVVIGTLEADGSLDLAPKHMAGPMSWENYFGFVCSPTHGTYKNILARQEFTVSLPRPEQVVLASLTASARCHDGSKPVVEVLPTFPATVVEGAFLENSYVGLECRLHTLVEDLGPNVLIIGKVVACRVHQDALVLPDADPHDRIHEHPLLAYLHPGRFARIEESCAFPFARDFKR